MPVVIALAGCVPAGPRQAPQAEAPRYAERVPVPAAEATAPVRPGQTPVRVVARPAAPAAAPAAPAAAPATPAVARGTLNHREPDLCAAQNLQALVGQPSGNLRTVVTKGKVRIVAPAQIVSQDEYDSTRVNAYIDGKGRITKLDCG